MKRILLASAVAVALMAATFSSCKKEKPDTESQSAVDNSICETEFSKSMSTVNGFAIKENGIKTMLDMANDPTRTMGPTIIVNPADTLDGFPITMIIDFGTGTTDSIDGRSRSGQVTCVFSDYWHNVGSTIKVTFTNFYVNGVHYECDSMKIIHGGAASFTHQVFSGRCTGPEYSLQWSGTHTVTQTGGTGDLISYNDVFSTTGNATGVNRNGKAYAVAISSALVKRVSCSWIESGKIDVTPEGLATRTVDFGNGNCDNRATLIINGNSFSFEMN